MAGCLSVGFCGNRSRTRHKTQEPRLFGFVSRSLVPEAASPRRLLAWLRRREESPETAAIPGSGTSTVRSARPDCAVLDDRTDTRLGGDCRPESRVQREVHAVRNRRGDPPPQAGWLRPGLNGLTGSALGDPPAQDLYPSVAQRPSRLGCLRAVQACSAEGSAPSGVTVIAQFNSVSMASWRRPIALSPLSI